MELSGTPPPSLLSSSSSSSSPAAASRIIYSDRFIPSRTGSNFALFDLCPSPPLGSSSSSSRRSPGGGREDGSGAYSALLRSVLFGSDTGGNVVPPTTPETRPLSVGRGSASSSSTGVAGGSGRSFTPASTSSSAAGSVVRRNIFRYKTEVRNGFSLAPASYDEGLLGAVAGPPKVSRKVPRTPYKVKMGIELVGSTSSCLIL